MAYTTINKPSNYFNTVTYTGDGTTNQTKAITFGFKPDLAWFKARDAGQSHIWVDSVRGGTKYLTGETLNAEATLGVAQLFTSTGMTVSNDASANSLNSSGSAKVSWGWVASNTTAVSNNSGSITSTVSANTTSGFSIVSYTGTGSNATVGHGLGVAPRMIIVKRRDSTANWFVYHASIGNDGYVMLNLTDGKDQPNSTVWNNTSPTSSLFSLGTSSGINASGGTYIAYCFAEVKGFSKFGSYTGNGSADGTFVYTGFKPAFVICRVVNSAVDWHLFDNKRLGYNASQYVLKPNSSGTEFIQSSILIDFLSNGFKFRGTDSAMNGSGQPHIYMAFAEQPLVGTNNVPATAR